MELSVEITHDENETMLERGASVQQSGVFYLLAVGTQYAELQCRE